MCNNGGITVDDMALLRSDLDDALLEAGPPVGRINVAINARAIDTNDGGLTTIHANSPRDGISRLEVMVSLANSSMQLVSIRQQIASAVHLLVQADSGD